MVIDSPVSSCYYITVTGYGTGYGTGFEKKYSSLEKNMRKAITIGDIAKQIGVSKTTISRILNGKPDVAPETKERVLDYIKQMGYVPSALARSLSKGRSNLVGILVPSLTDIWTLELLHGVSETIENSPYNLVLFALGSPEAFQTFFENTLPMGLLAGLILVLPPANLPQITELIASDFPVILIDDRGAYPEHSSVTVTNFQGAYDATRHFQQLGHTRIGYISGPHEVPYFRERLAGYRAAMQDAGLSIEPGLIVECESNKECAFAVVQNWLKGIPPTAIFSSVDMMAFGALDALLSNGKRVPEDVALIGFDDLPSSAHINPPLTTVKEPIVLMGQTAAKMLLEWVQTGQLAQKHVELQTELIIRTTCGGRQPQIT
jgi:LacI family transcriptional regulator